MVLAPGEHKAVSIYALSFNPESVEKFRSLPTEILLSWAMPNPSKVHQKFKICSQLFLLTWMQTDRTKET